jgi:hypothetical protein
MKFGMLVLPIPIYFPNVERTASQFATGCIAVVRCRSPFIK